jgi:hypothetical protein
MAALVKSTQQVAVRIEVSFKGVLLSTSMVEIEAGEIKGITGMLKGPSDRRIPGMVATPSVSDGCG